MNGAFVHLRWTNAPFIVDGVREEREAVMSAWS
jgi:hypothetical protein